MLAFLAVGSPWLFLVYLTRSADTDQHPQRDENPSVAGLQQSRLPLRVPSRRLLSNTLPNDCRVHTHTHTITQQVCSVCGTAFEGNMNEVMEMQESMLVGITRRRVKKDKVDRPALLL